MLLVNVIVHQWRLIQLVVSVLFFFLLLKVLLKFFKILLVISCVHDDLIYFARGSYLEVDLIPFFFDPFEVWLHELLKNVTIRV